jgi:hypothetical protein
MTERLDAVRADIASTLDLAREDTSQKLDLARRELAEKGKQAGVGLGMLGAAGVGALLGLGALTACLVLLLDRWMPPDLAALIVALVWAAVAAVAAVRGRGKVQEAADVHPERWVPRRTIDAVKDEVRDAKNVGALVPEQTIETVKEDVEWAKTRGRSDAR